MTDSTSFSPDLPELRVIAESAGIKPSHLAAAFNNPEHFFANITLEELEQVVNAFDRLTALRTRMMSVMEIVTTSLAAAISAITPPGVN